VNISTVRTASLGEAYGGEPFFDFFNDFMAPFEDLDTGRTWKEQGLGSGVIVAPDGYIVTNNHVVADAEKIRVTLFDKRVFTGEVLGADPKTDLAIVKIEAHELPTLPWADSDHLSVGEFVLAIGNPFGLSHTVTVGIVSAVGRADVGIADYEDFIQTDAAINPGNSGGPLVDTAGRLIGINTAIFSKSGGYQGIGFAVPSNMARLIMDQLIEKGKVTRGWIGVSIQDLTPELAGAFGVARGGGVLISEIIPGGPAADAGLGRGDVILSIDGRGLDSPSALRNLVAQSAPGTKAALAIAREGKGMAVNVTIGEQPSSSDEARPRPKPVQDGRQHMRETFSGVSVMSLTPEIVRQLGLKSTARGVVVVSVQAGSPADAAGLLRGDLIVEIDRARIGRVEDWEKAVARRNPLDPSLVYVNRGGRHMYMFLSPS
jgi:serine protease Do